MNKACLEFKNPEDFKTIDYNSYGRDDFWFDLFVIVFHLFAFLSLLLLAGSNGYLIVLSFLWLFVCFDVIDSTIAYDDALFDADNYLHKKKHGYYSLLK